MRIAGFGICEFESDTGDFELGINESRLIYRIMGISLSIIRVSFRYSIGGN